MTPKCFVESLAILRFTNVFNPYSGRCAVHDRADAPRRRSDTLSRMLEAALATEIDAVWIGRDLGYRGGRRTGLALTDDVHLATHAERWGISVERPTKGEVITERTAAIIWRMLASVHTPVFLWNVFPFHPHESGAPFSNRGHNSQERIAGEEILFQLITLLKPRRLVAIGKDAAISARRLANNRKVVQVRHPSYGGQKKFLEQMTELYA